MSDEDNPYNIIDPEMRKFVKALEKMPEYLAEQEANRLKHIEFIYSVFGDAIKDAFGPDLKLPHERLERDDGK